MKHRNAANPKFQLCCGNGKVQLPLLKEPPSLLQHLLFSSNFADSKNYQQNIWAYNMMFAFTSLGAKLDNSFNNGKWPPNLRIQGQSCHRIGNLLPLPGQLPKFVQLYIYDNANEIHNRMKFLR